jgi:N-acetylated-alpha-linked acidic dipeptidase
LVLNLVNEQEYVITPIWNVIGIINGTLADEVIVVGNHRDAWILGGAGDPNSGSAAINEVIRSFGKAVELGWKPLRTIVFASWDGEEYGLIGSTEWVEEYLPWLTATNVAYVNMDVGCSGHRLGVSASPLLNSIIYEVTDLVLSPNQTVKGQTVRDVWDGKISTMGSGSDFTAFQDYAGIPSVDIGFSPGPNDAVYHYHSNYDSFHWMSTYGDPGFKYHVAAAQILGLFTAKLSETPVIPLNTTDYADALKGYVAQAEAKLNSVSSTSDDEDDADFRFRPTVAESSSTGSLDSLTAKFKLLHRAVAELQNATANFENNAASLAEQAGVDIPWWKWISKIKLYYAIKKSNSKVKYLERQFLYAKGLDSRHWFKHVVFAPGLWTGYAGAVFPGFVEAIDAKDYKSAAKWILIIEDVLKKATASLE